MSNCRAARQKCPDWVGVVLFVAAGLALAGAGLAGRAVPALARPPIPLRLASQHLDVSNALRGYVGWRLHAARYGVVPAEGAHSGAPCVQLARTRRFAFASDVLKVGICAAPEGAVASVVRIVYCRP